jgi:hypothetical protein
MTMMNGIEIGNIDILDEDYYGPPPRFLRERKRSEFCSDPEMAIAGDDDGSLPGLRQLKALLSAW